MTDKAKRFISSIVDTVKAYVLKPIPMPSNVKSYPASAVTFTIDKTGAVYNTTQGGNPFALRVYRTAPKQQPAILFENAGGHGELTVINRQLYLGYTDQNWMQWYVPIPGYIDPDDKPSSTIVNVDESAMKVYVAQVNIAISTANTAVTTASQANRIANTTAKQVDALTQQVAALQNQIATLQQNMLTKFQVEDITWQKTWDILYLIRMGYINGRSDIQQVQDWLNDLTTFIVKYVKGTN
jgi:hypothetical protein